MKFNQSFSITFWLFKRKQLKNGLVPIYARITIDGTRAECSVKRRIHPDAWEPNPGRAKDTYLEAPVLNEYLSLVHAEIGKHYNMLLSTTDHVTAEQVKESYQGTKHKKTPAKKSFLLLFSGYLETLESKVKIGDLSVGRYKRFGVLYRKCEAFIRYTFKKSDLLPEAMKINFITRFQHYLRVREGISHNTAMKYAKDLKQVMGYITMEEDLPNNVFRSFKCTFKRVKRKYLTEEELDRLYTKVLPIKRLEEVRDCFIFCCYTGYSYSDAAALTPKDIVKGIDGGWWILRDRQKTGETENVPLLPIPLALIEKYRRHDCYKVQGKLLPFNSNQRYNAYLKELADICRIEKNLTTHMARHTCATTVLLSNDVPIETAKEFLGHHDIRTTQIYANVVQKKLSNDIRKLNQKITKKREKINERPSSLYD